MLIANAANSDASYQIQSRDFIHDLHAWIHVLPTAKHERLHEASQSFAQAVADYTRLYCSAIASGTTNPHPEAEPSVQARLNRFRSVGGLWKAWNRIVQDAAAFNSAAPTDEQQGAIDIGDQANLPSTQAAVENRIRNYADTIAIKMERTIDDLFSE